MALREEFERSGNWLFRWRSYLPLVFIVLFLIALTNFKYQVSEHLSDDIWELFCLFVSFSGLAVRMYAVGCAPRGTSGRNVAEQRANVLNTTGIYSVTRHPLYFGNFIIWLGITMSVRLWWFMAVALLVFWLYYERIMFTEEEFLRKKFGEEFLKWSNTTPAFFPIKWNRWRKPALPFKFKSALRREYSGFFAIISVFAVLDLVEERIVTGEFTADPMWVGIFTFGFVTYLTLLIFKKKTKLLDIEGR